MSNNKQTEIDLRQPRGAFSKLLLVLMSVVMVSFLVCGLVGECEEAVWKWLVVTMAVVPAFCCTGVTLFVLWGRKCLLLEGDMVEIRWELWGLHRVRRVQLGRQSRLVLSRTTCETTSSEDGTTISELLELHLTDAHRQRHCLLQFDVRHRARVDQIAAEIVQHLPQLELVQE